jgi:hypothetical protein
MTTLLKKDIENLYNNIKVKSPFYIKNYHILHRENYKENDEIVFKDNVCYSYLHSDIRKMQVKILNECFAKDSIKLKFLEFFKNFAFYLDINVSYEFNEEFIIITYKSIHKDRAMDEPTLLLLGTFLRTIHEEHCHGNYFKIMCLILMDLIRFLEIKKIKYKENIYSIFNYLHNVLKIYNKSSGHTLFNVTYKDSLYFNNYSNDHFFKKLKNMRRGNIQYTFDCLYDNISENTKKVDNFFTIKKENFSSSVVLDNITFEQYLFNILTIYFSYYFNYNFTEKDMRYFVYKKMKNLD